jgi:hypothetical protein
MARGELVGAVGEIHTNESSPDSLDDKEQSASARRRRMDCGPFGVHRWPCESAVGQTETTISIWQ